MSQVKPKHAGKRNETNELGSRAAGGTTPLGWPGYRTRPNRSGLDPLDSDNEAGHMGGIFLREVLSLRLRTRNPLALLMLLLLGVIPFLFLAALLISTLIAPQNGLRWTELIVPFLFLLVTGCLSINFVLSIIRILGRENWKKGIR